MSSDISPRCDKYTSEEVTKKLYRGTSYEVNDASNEYVGRAAQRPDDARGGLRTFFRTVSFCC